MTTAQLRLSSTKYTAVSSWRLGTRAFRNPAGDRRFENRMLAAIATATRRLPAWAMSSSRRPGLLGAIRMEVMVAGPAICSGRGAAKARTKHTLSRDEKLPAAMVTASLKPRAPERGRAA